MITIAEQLIKLLNNKNIAFVVLLLITLGSGYLVFSFTSTLLQDNKVFIEKLDKIYEILSIHEKKHEN